jgi:hypothetical protein
MYLYIKIEYHDIVYFCLTVSSNVFVIFDRYKEKSIKGSTRPSRAAYLRQYNIRMTRVIALATPLLSQCFTQHSV